MGTVSSATYRFWTIHSYRVEKKKREVVWTLRAIIIPAFSLSLFITYKKNCFLLFLLLFVRSFLFIALLYWFSLCHKKSFLMFLLKIKAFWFYSFLCVIRKAFLMFLLKIKVFWFYSFLCVIRKAFSNVSFKN